MELVPPEFDANNVVVETERLMLRHFLFSDNLSMNQVFGDTEVMRYGVGVHSCEWVKEWIRHSLDCYATKGFGLWAVVEKSSQEVTGYCGLTHFSDIDEQPEIEIGYRLACRYWGNGYATEAARAVRDYAFESLGLKRLIALIDPENIASIRVAEKIGLRYEKDVMLEGYTHPDRLYAIASSRE